MSTAVHGNRIRVWSRFVLRDAKRFAFLCLAVALFGASGLAQAQDTAGSVPVLTSAAQVLALPEGQAARALPVRLRGVVVGEAQPIGKAFVLRDASESLYVRWDAPGDCTFRRGDLVEVEGTSGAGGFAPLLYMSSGQKLGTGALPAPRELTAEQLIAGQFDAQWVRVRGIVRRCESADTWAGRERLTLALGNQLLAVHVDTGQSLAGLVDAEVVVDGLFFNQHNVSRQFVRALIFVPRDVPIAIEVAAPADPFAAPVRPVGSLLQFERHGRYGHRIHVRGRVLHHPPGGWLWIRDGERGLRVASRQTERLSPGDSVDVIGFPTQGGYTPRLEDAEFRRSEPGEPPPAATPADMRAAIAHDSDLVAIDARLVESRRTRDGVALVLDWQGSLVPAVLPIPDGEPVTADWIPGSLVRATGICTVSKAESAPAGGLWEPRAFELQLRTAADLSVLQPPPWWTRGRILWTLGSLAGGLLLAVAGVMLAARRRLRDQEIRRAKAEAEFSAILAERNRLAREIHDTLAQGLAAISMQLELAKTEGEKDRAAAGDHLEIAHRLVRESLAEARASIWNMRSQVLETHDLPGALEKILRQLAAGTPVESTFRVTGERAHLPPFIEGELLRIGQEAITNALKHAAPHHVGVALLFAERQVGLVVTDDGIGFDAARVGIGSGRFGLVGMRERAAQLGAQLEIASSPGKGTRISLRVQTPD